MSNKEKLSIQIEYEKCNFYTNSLVKFIYFEKTAKFGEIFTLLLTGTTKDKSEVKILQNFVAFSEYMNFTKKYTNIRSDNILGNSPQLCHYGTIHILRQHF